MDTARQDSITAKRFVTSAQEQGFNQTQVILEFEFEDGKGIKLNQLKSLSAQLDGEVAVEVLVQCGNDILLPKIHPQREKEAKLNGKGHEIKKLEYRQVMQEDELNGRPDEISRFHAIMVNKQAELNDNANEVKRLNSHSESKRNCMQILEKQEAKLQEMEHEIKKLKSQLAEEGANSNEKSDDEKNLKSRLVTQESKLTERSEEIKKLKSQMDKQAATLNEKQDEIKELNSKLERSRREQDAKIQLMMRVQALKSCLMSMVGEQDSSAKLGKLIYGAEDAKKISNNVANMLRELNVFKKKVNYEKFDFEEDGWLAYQKTWSKIKESDIGSLIACD